MKKLMSFLFVVYFVVSWKQYQCSGTCANNYWDSITLEYRSPGYRPPKESPGNCSMSVETKEQQFDDRKSAEEFISANMKGHSYFFNNGPSVSEELLNDPNNLKWDFKKKKITVQED